VTLTLALLCLVGVAVSGLVLLAAIARLAPPYLRRREAYRVGYEACWEPVGADGERCRRPRGHDGAHRGSSGNAPTS
jgi:hypothetical protein